MASPLRRRLVTSTVEPCADRAAADNLRAPPPPTFGDRRAAAADAILGVFIFSMTKKVISKYF